MRYYHAELQRLQQEIMEMKKAQAKLLDLQFQQEELKERTAKLQKLMTDEQEDVDRLNKGSLAAFFYKVSGKMEEKLSAEEKEAYAARVKYETAASELEAINKDITDCQRKTRSLPKYEEQYQTLLKEETEKVKNSGEPEAEQIMRIEKRLSFLDNQKKEIEEAVTAGGQSLQIVDRILKQLDNAEDWSTIDMIGGGLFADLAKYDHLSQVQDLTTELQNSLRSFRTELADVTDKISGNIRVEIGEFLHFADYFFDGFFTDWMVYEKITESKDLTLQTQKQIQDILDRLKRIQDDICREEDARKKELEQIVSGCINKYIDE